MRAIPRCCWIAGSFVFSLCACTSTEAPVSPMARALHGSNFAPGVLASVSANGEPMMYDDQLGIWYTLQEQYQRILVNTGDGQLNAIVLDDPQIRADAANVFYNAVVDGPDYTLQMLNDNPPPADTLYATSVVPTSGPSLSLTGVAASPPKVQPASKPTLNVSVGTAANGRSPARHGFHPIPHKTWQFKLVSHKPISSAVQPSPRAEAGLHARVWAGNF